ncbi:MAG: ABC transporter substrate-binding protein [Bacteroidetes bacterium]|nr:ABC transporter substrate-binding protein [Bacteroidota bacterium]MCL2302079.1 ABC transporter substrate-binding protein [Lentimicrobiaceae bacterium]
MKHNLLSYFITFLTLCLFVACSSSATSDKKIFRYNEAVGIQSLDPAYASGQAATWVCNMLYNGLVDLDDSLHVVPMIAKSWTISPDGKTYTFYLRDDVFFQHTNHYFFDKPPRVTAADFVYSFNRIVSPEVASPGAWIFQKVAKNDAGNYAFFALSDTTFQIVLTEPFPPFLGMLAMKYASVVPQEVVEQYGKDFRKFPVGTGPFQFQLWEEGIKLVLRKNENYFEKDENNEQLPYLDAIAISFIIDKQVAFMEFMKGNLDFISGIEASYKDALLTKEGTLQEQYTDKITLQTGPFLNTEYLGFLLKDKENNPLLIREIRQAINYGFDREKMIRYLRNNMGYAGTSGFVPLGMASFNSERIKGYHYNPEKALELLQIAGFPNGVGLPVIPLSVSASYLDLCQYIQHELNKIGIRISLEVQQAAQQRQMMRSYQLPFFRGSWICDYPDAENYLSLFYSKNLQPIGSNYTHYINPVFDELFEKSQTITDEVLRNEYYTILDSLLMEDAPVVVLFYDKKARFTQKNISGLDNSPTNLLDLRRVTKQSPVSPNL